MLNNKKMIFFANWKIYLSSRYEVEQYVKEVNKGLPDFDSDVLELHIMTDFLSFEYVKKNITNQNIKIGVQDLCWEDRGSFAGEVSPLMLKNLGCDSVYLGHSERKLYFGENDINVHKKIVACFRNNIIPFVFIGETKEELDNNMTEEVLLKQLKTCLNKIKTEFLKNIIIIYEPRWAIGQDEAANLSTIKAMHIKTKSLIKKLYGNGAASCIRILYGGSVNLDNIKDIIEIPEVDGAGAARAAINPLDFIKLARIVEIEAKKRFRG